MGGSLSSAIGQEASKQSSPYIRPIHSVRDLCAASPNTRLTTNNYSPGEGMKVINGCSCIIFVYVDRNIVPIVKQEDC
jgi:hypothetical protein